MLTILGIKLSYETLVFLGLFLLLYIGLSLSITKPIMRYYYAQIDENNIATSILDTFSSMDLPTHIQLVEFDETILGKTWNGSSWEETPT